MTQTMTYNVTLSTLARIIVMASSTGARITATYDSVDSQQSAAYACELREILLWLLAQCVRRVSQSMCPRCVNDSVALPSDFQSSEQYGCPTVKSRATFISPRSPSAVLAANGTVETALKVRWNHWLIRQRLRWLRVCGGMCGLCRAGASGRRSKLNEFAATRGLAACRPINCSRCFKSLLARCVS